MLNTIEKIIHQRTEQFLLALGVAIAIYFLPLLDIPVRWLGLFFHEFSQGMVAVLSGGKFMSLDFAKGNVKAVFTHHDLWIPLFAGYMGNIFGGVLIYYSAQIMSPKLGNFAATIAALLVGITILFVGKSDNALLLGELVCFGLIMIIPLRRVVGVRIFYKIISLSLIISVMLVPIDSVFLQMDVDAQSLSDLLSAPTPVWLMCWFAMAVITMRFIWIDHCMNGW
ncbi:MAG: M50 family metallopeptidase [Alphaproteobacteria bacterium]|nr:M50 family metallopeptidase [Alphaproteobacteria bacterium]